MDKVDQLVRQPTFNKEDVELNRYAKDYMVPVVRERFSLFDKSVMTTFERYFIADRRPISRRRDTTSSIAKRRPVK